MSHTAEEIAEELAERIREDLAFYQGAMPDRAAVSWSGYIAGLLEWGLLTVGLYRDLHALLPNIPDDPVVDIFTGRGTE